MSRLRRDRHPRQQRRHGEERLRAEESQPTITGDVPHRRQPARRILALPRLRHAGKGAQARARSSTSARCRASSSTSRNRRRSPSVNRALRPADAFARALFPVLYRFAAPLEGSDARRHRLAALTWDERGVGRCGVGQLRLGRSGVGWRGVGRRGVGRRGMDAGAWNAVARDAVAWDSFTLD